MKAGYTHDPAVRGLVYGSVVMTAAVDNPEGLGRFNDYSVRVPSLGVTTTIYNEIRFGDSPLPLLNVFVGNATLNQTLNSTLKAGLQYDVFIVVEDTITPVPNLSPVPTKIQITMPSSNALLTSVALGSSLPAGTLWPAFSPDLLVYSAFLPSDTLSVLELSVVPTAENTSSVVLTNNGTGSMSLLSNVYAYVPLAFGLNVLVINVTAEDTVTVLSYVINVHRVASLAKANATLAVLSVTFVDTNVTLNSTLMGGKAWPSCVLGCSAESPSSCSLSNPSCVMDAGTPQLLYEVGVPTGINTISVHVQASQPGYATVRMWTLGNPSWDLPGPMLGKNLSLPTTGWVANYNDTLVNLNKLQGYSGTMQKNVINLMVTAGDGFTSNNYTLVVNRYGPASYEGSFTGPVIPSTNSRMTFGMDDLLTARVSTGGVTPSLTVFPTVDISAPLFISTYPRIANASSGSVELVVMINEPGVCYYLFLPAGARAPTPREVKEGLRADAVKWGVITDLYLLTRQASAVVSGLSSATAYDVYLVAEDLAKDFNMYPDPNLQSSAFRIAMTTAA